MSEFREGAMTDESVRVLFTVAGNHLDLAIYHLRAVRQVYDASTLPGPVKQARLEAIDAKIAAVRDVRANYDAHPWCEDEPALPVLARRGKATRGTGL